MFFDILIMANNLYLILLAFAILFFGVYGGFSIIRYMITSIRFNLHFRKLNKNEQEVQKEIIEAKPKTETISEHLNQTNNANRDSPSAETTKEETEHQTENKKKPRAKRKDAKKTDAVIKQNETQTQNKKQNKKKQETKTKQRKPRRVYTRRDNKK